MTESTEKTAKTKESKFSADHLKYLQALPLDLKIKLTKQRIREWAHYWGNQIFVSFSGGKDSTVLLDIVRQEFPDTPAVFVDTGLEYPEIKEFVRQTPNVTILRPSMSFRKVIETYGYPVASKEIAQSIYTARRTPNGKVAHLFDDDNIKKELYGSKYDRTRYRPLLESDIPVGPQCCSVMKKLPIKHYEKETGRHGIVGTMVWESRLRRQVWLYQGCNAFDAKRPISAPMSFWLEQDILEYIDRFKTRYCCVYGDLVRDEKSGLLLFTGCQRTGCVFCMFGAHLEKEPNRFQKLKQTHPKLWEYCMKPSEEGGLGLKRVCDFMKIKTE